MREIKARCYFGCDRPATYPASSPRWCTVRCAAEWAAGLKDTDDEEKWRPCCRRWEYDATHACNPKEETHG